jgi:(p)ppGpp synthase/HD superfamily hydrolase
MREQDGGRSIFSPLIEQAAELAAQWHDRTYRKGTWREPAFSLPSEETHRIPTVAHVTAVALIVQRAGWDDATVAAAFLHDAIEDANRFGDAFRTERMRELVGDEVTALVLEVTEVKFAADGRRRSWKERKVDYVAHLASGTAEAAAISLADKLHNLWSINESLERGIDVFRSGPERRGLTAGRDDQLWFHNAVLAGVARHTDPRLIPMRDLFAAEIERFERLTAG